MRPLRLFYLVFGFGLVLLLAGEPARAAPAAPVNLTVVNPYCVQASPASGVCFINFRYLSAYTTDQSFTHIEITVDGKVRLYMTGFFEPSATLVAHMLGDGLAVSCGLPNASGSPNYGRIYSVGITGFASGSSPTTDIANITCPSYESRSYLPMLSR